MGYPHSSAQAASALSVQASAAAAQVRPRPRACLTTNSLCLPSPPQPDTALGGDAEQAARAAQLVRDAFASCKYQLRQAFRRFDTNRNGLLRTFDATAGLMRRSGLTRACAHMTAEEDDFMEALEYVSDALTDQDKFALAQVYFPRPTSVVDYAALLAEVFAEAQAAPAVAPRAAAPRQAWGRTSARPW